MRGSAPRQLAEALERHRRLPPGDGERLSGYAVVGLPFTLGHVLSLRRYAASSIGPPFTTVWHRDPAGRWTIYCDVEPSRSCPRYFAASVSALVTTDIGVEWTGDHALSVSIPDHRLEWAVRFEATASTRLLSAVGALTPAGLRHGSRPLVHMGRVAGRLLQAGRMNLVGRVPNGQRYAAIPRRVWVTTASAAVVGGTDIGPLGPLETQPRLGDYHLPSRGLLTFGDTWFESLDPSVHHPAVAGVADRSPLATGPRAASGA